MPTLRKFLRHPGTYLGFLGLILASAYADSFRPPDHQFFAGAYIALVRKYQTVGSPLMTGFVQCRYHPTCSRYSIEAVQKYGLRKGFCLTSARLWRCRNGVPVGIHDPVP